MVTVKVVSRRSGHPVKNVMVALGSSAIFSGGVTKGQYTDSNGEAHFDVSPGNWTIFIDGSVEHKGYISGRTVVYV